MKTFVIVAALLAAGAAQAATKNGVINADLTQLANGGTVTEPLGLKFSDDPGGAVLTGWSNSGYNFVYTPGSADNLNAPQAQDEYGATYLWGPNDGSDNGFTGATPLGGNFFGLDGAYQTGPVTGYVAGMTAGDTYTLSFEYAGIQQYGYNGATTETVQVSIGGTTYPTEPVLNDASNGFTGWQQETINFVASSSVETLSFLAIGTPGGVPPFTLLGDISVPVAVPEPAAWTLMIVGFGALGVALRNRRRLAVA